ncbi:MAG: glycosyl transferase, partial [Acidobacteriales bacterium]|nr:glycosyl transferase [Terriglobales bacterium]
MPTNTHLALISEEAERLAESIPGPLPSDAALRARGRELPNQLSWLPNEPRSKWFAVHTSQVWRDLEPILASAGSALPDQPISEDLRTLHDSVRLLESEADSVVESLKKEETTPHVRDASGQIIPRAAAIAEAFLRHTGNRYSEQEFSTFIEGFQTNVPLQMKELWALVPAMKLVLLERVIALGTPLLTDPMKMTGVEVPVQSLRDVGQTSWKDLIEPLICFEAILREDPAGAYARMEFDSRDLYRTRLVQFAERSDCSELEVAQQAVALAREASRQRYEDPRVKLRHSHVGYYIVGDGAPRLQEKTGYRPNLGARIHELLRNHPDEFYLPGVELLTFAIILAIVLPLIGVSHSLSMLVFAALVSLLPASQSAVQLMNYLTTTVLRPQILPKLDFSEGVPQDCLTLIAVPALLLNENQVRTLVDDLEVRYLGNHDPQIHLALLTDLPDSREQTNENSPLVDLCSELISGLNQKYAGRQEGTFLMLHRHRIYNPHEKVWMGWERKRGKLLELNRLLRGQHDSFPVKVGDVSILPRVRFVITLDADTELPRGSAPRMIGTMAHPLNQAIIDPENNIVVAGYGILQPRVGVSVASASTSRLASIYSGETGLDIYSRAVSDVYQDLYGEGSFTGKGIYEVDTVHQVLDRRFPRNALLSHDLIEGAYARAGLASDVEVIEDYPSHYSAYNRRKHRWLRGDWQIAGWLLPRVPDESGAKVKNPITLISQWKILDNLRRSLVEPATFVMLVLGWLVLPATALYWTLAILGILFVPAFCQLLFQLTRAAITGKLQAARDAVDGLFTTTFHVFLTLTFLAHQTMLSVDAV